MNRPLLIGIIAAVLVIGGVAVYELKKGPEEGQQLTDAQVRDILSSVGRHIKLPAGEEPLVATVADVNLLLEREPFYKGADNGDILLLYPNAGKAILYAPDEDIIVNVGPIIIDENAEAAAAAEAEAPAEEDEETPEETTEQ